MLRPRFAIGGVALLAVLLTLAACGDDGDEVGAPTSTGTSAPATVAASPTGAADLTATPEPGITEEPFEGGREPVEVPGGTAPPVALLADVRAASHEGFDRIVFEFSGALPGYRVEYVQQPIACGSGLGAEVAGVAYIQVRMTPAAAHDDTGSPTFETREISPSLPAIIQAAQTCDFEADLTWVVGLNAEVDFRVADLEEPFRVVVDVAQP